MDLGTKYVCSPVTKSSNGFGHTNLDHSRTHKIEIWSIFVLIYCIICVSKNKMSVVVTSRHTRKTSVSLYTIVPRYTITTPLPNEALAGTGGAWRDCWDASCAFCLPRETCPTDTSVGRPGRELVSRTG